MEGLEDVISFILAGIVFYRHDVGHAINWRGINLKAITTQPPHIARRLAEAADIMTESGLLELRGEDHFLTQAGYNRAYGL